MSKNSYQIKFIEKLSEISKASWNELIGDFNPFLEYDFLNGLEVSESVGKKSGWVPHHIVVYQNNILVGATPLYLKYNSLGEYIFDWQWVGLYKHYGVDYFPKFVVGIPFTPATGKRALVHPDYNYNEIFNLIIEYMLQIANEKKINSIHWLFITKEEAQILEKKKFFFRKTYQYHWHNQNYTNFDNFIGKFNAKRRNQVKRERNINSEIEIEILCGDSLKEHHWQHMYSFYLLTIDKKWAYPYLTPCFFTYLKDHFSKYTVMIFAKHQGEYVAGALNFRKNKNMYGRYWGCLKKYRNLHFEICYYKSVEYCIDEKIDLYEAGAQGEHKIHRGYLPKYTYSAHWISNAIFSPIVGELIKEGNQHTEYEIEELLESSPFKKTT